MASLRLAGRRSIGGVEFPHPVWWWLGVTAVSVGVALHLPMYFGAADMHYRLVGMAPDAPMLVGMALIVLGLGAVGYGVIGGRRDVAARNGTPVVVRGLDDAPLRPQHLALLAAMSIAITIDAMKPITLGFVVPGMAKEYGLKSPLNPHGSVPVALLPLFALGGTVIGSLLWGWLGDRIGRRASILLAGVLFIATSICGAMPSYQWNFAMCFMMGVAVGGMLPITITLIAELLPKRHRGWAIVLVGGELALAYVITSALAHSLIPTYSWRSLWLLGLPTGALLIALQRWIPESPRFLLLRGRSSEAREVLERYGARVVAPALRGVEETRSPAGWRGQVPAGVIVVLLAVAAGLVTYGFQLWIPTNLQKLGFTDVSSTDILRDSALIGLPITLAVAYLYAFWSTRGTIILLSTLTTASLVALAISGNSIVSHRAWLHILLAVPTAAINSVLAVALAYAAEAYPTAIRSRATGVAAGLSKAGGVVFTALVVASVAPASIRETALLGAIPLSLGAVAVAVAGRETRSRSLEELETGRASTPEAAGLG